MSKTTALEKRIVRHLIRTMLERGYKPTQVFDSEEYIETKTEKAVISAGFAVEDSTIHFDGGKGANGHSHGVLIVLGNGIDCLSDWHTGDGEFSAVMDQVMDWIDELPPK